MQLVVAEWTLTSGQARVWRKRNSLRVDAHPAVREIIKSVNDDFDSLTQETSGQPINCRFVQLSDWPGNATSLVQFEKSCPRRAQLPSSPGVLEEVYLVVFGGIGPESIDGLRTTS